jgi:protein-disulfide isomerase
MSSRAQEKAALREQREEAQRAESARAARKRRLGLLAGAAGLAVVVVVLLIVLGGGSGDKAEQGLGAGEKVAGVAATKSLIAGIPQKGTVLGNPDAPVTMTEFVDLQCPFCREYTLNALPGIIDRYVKPGKLKIDLRVLTFIGPDSQTAGALAEAAARQNHIWEFTDLFYRNQGQENSGYANTAFLRRLARATPGLDASKALAERDSDPVAAALKRADTAAQNAGVTSTPGFLAARGGGLSRKIEPASLTTSAFTSSLDKLVGSG